MKWDDIVRKATRTKLWAMVGGGGIGLEIINEGIGMTDAVPGVQILTILGGVALVAASVTTYLFVEGNIDKAREEAKALLLGSIWEEDEEEN